MNQMKDVFFYIFDKRCERVICSDKELLGLKMFLYVAFW